MILRRITMALKRQDWITVSIETLIVVLGVFLGLQANNWNEARVERGIVMRWLRGMIGEARDAKAALGAYRHCPYGNPRPRNGTAFGTPASRNVLRPLTS
ncbi:MAG: hypothetical protein R3C40_11665 [Parvularculaceae bacterium]